MRYGLELPVGGVCADPRFLAELAALAEESGFAGVFCEDYITYGTAPDCPTADPWVALAAMAVATARVRLGTTVTAVARRRPWKLAREVATLDRLSGGRVTLGVGLGDAHDPGFARVGEPTGARVRAARLDEGLAVLRGLWPGEPFSFTGAQYQVNDVVFRPAAPDVRVWVGGGWPRRAPLRRALGQDGFCPYRFDPGDPYRDAVAEITAADVREMRAAVIAARGTMDGFDIVLGGQRRRADWAERVPAVAEAGASWWMEWVPPGTRAEMRAAVARGPYGGDQRLG